MYGGSLLHDGLLGAEGEAPASRALDNRARASAGAEPKLSSTAHSSPTPMPFLQIGASHSRLSFMEPRSEMLPFFWAADSYSRALGVSSAELVPFALTSISLHR